MKTQENIGFCITCDYNSITREDVFSPLLKVLMAYSHKLIGNSSLRLNKSRNELAYDLAMESITRYLENPSDFDSTRNPDLVNYLKFNVLRRLISNFKMLKGQKNELLYEPEDSNGIKVTNSFIKENDLNLIIDLENIIGLIYKQLDDNPILSELFELRYFKDFTRSEIINELNISPGEYNNRIRRLDTVLHIIVKMYEKEARI